jgi:hypothetical protein
MAFNKIEVSLASAVAVNGTFTASYPNDPVTGYPTTAGDFAAYGHKMFCRGLQAMFTQDLGGMSASFGASDITVTYRGSTSIPAGTVVDVSFNCAGPDDKAIPDISRMKRMNIGTPVLIDLGAPDTADADGILESQDLTSAGVYSVLAFNGVYGDPYSNLKAVLDVPRNVVGAWTTAAVVTVTGKDEYGDVIVEKCASGTSFTGTKAFKEITSISTATSITAATFGTGDVLGLPVYVDKVGRLEAEYQDGVKLATFGNNKMLIPWVLDQTDLLAPTAVNLVAPTAGYITGIRVIVQAAVTTGGAITVEANTVAVVGLSATVGDAATAGTVISDDVLKIATGLVAAGDDITVTPAAAFATAGRVAGYLIFEPISKLNGTFVPGVQTLPTATTGDVRGTYDPAELCNGSLSFSLLAMVPDPTYKGVDNYDG